MANGPPPEAPRMSLGNMTSGEVLTAQFNPEDLKRIVAVAYARLGVLGQSHEQLQFQFRPNERLTLTLHFDQHARGGQVSTAMDIQGALDAMTLGSRKAQDIASGGPPDVLMLWPGVLKIRCRITQLEYDYRRLASDDGSVTLLSVKVSVEEASTKRRYAEDVRRKGLMRGD